ITACPTKLLPKAGHSTPRHIPRFRESIDKLIEGRLPRPHSPYNQSKSLVQICLDMHARSDNTNSKTAWVSSVTETSIARRPFYIDESLELISRKRRILVVLFPDCAHVSNWTCEHVDKISDVGKKIPYCSTPQGMAEMRNIRIGENASRGEEID